MLKQRVLTALVLVGLLLPALFAPVAWPFALLTLLLIAAAGWEWIKFWGEPDAAVAFLEKTGYFPASTTAAADPRISENPLYKPAADTLGFGIPSPSFPGYAGWTESVVLPAFQRILIKEATVAEAVDEIIAGLAAAIG